MSKADRTVETLITEMFWLISAAQRNGMSGHDAIVSGVRPFMSRLLESEVAAEMGERVRQDLKKLCVEYFNHSGRDTHGLDYTTIIGHGLEQIALKESEAGK